jgi:5'-deoxynucleotidase YfbR-like HD superfamily hydrolase
VSSSSSTSSNPSVGDFTPLENVPGHVKAELEAKAMDSFLNEMLGGGGNAQARERFRSLWEEYEARETPESKLVKDLDRLELALQGVEYERCELGRIVELTDSAGHRHAPLVLPQLYP